MAIFLLKLRIMAMLYTHSIGNPPQNTMAVFEMRDNVPSARYSPICNVLRQWKTSLIPIYRVYTDSMIILLFIIFSTVLIYRLASNNR